MPKSVEMVEYNGLKFRRYPESKDWASRIYFTPPIHAKLKDARRLHEEVWLSHFRCIPKGYDIHHKDFNPSNNDITNLECLPKAGHKELHASLKRGISQPLPAKALEMAKLWHKSEKGRAFHRIIGAMGYQKATYEKYNCIVCGFEFESRDMRKGHPKYCSPRCKQQLRVAEGKVHEIRKCRYCGIERKVQKCSTNETCSIRCFNALLKQTTSLQFIY